MSVAILHKMKRNLTLLTCKGWLRKRFDVTASRALLLSRVPSLASLARGCGASFLLRETSLRV